MLLDLDMPVFDDDQFRNELRKYSRLNHPNLFRLVGYWGQIRHDLKISGALCFENLPSGSLDDHLSDPLRGLDWHTRYRIIKGTCKGLESMHLGLKEPMNHPSLEPSSILLDQNMEPKLAALGFLKFIRGALSVRGFKYFPQEYNDGGELSEKVSIYSLGVVIIEIVTGPMDWSRRAYYLPQHFFDTAEGNWRKRLQQTCSGSDLELCCQQVKRCITIALKCVENDEHDRPNIQEIINELNETEIDIDHTEAVVLRDQELLPRTVGESSSMDEIYIDQINTLESIVGGSKGPSSLKYPLLQFITKEFSKELEIGSGGCGVVYKGILRNVIIAVKRISTRYTIEDKMFDQEVKSMMMVKHINIVKFLGSCSHTKEKPTDYNGKIVMAEERERLLCFEYISNGSLDKHITDELRGLQWQTRYQIIKGICEGLHHLHREIHILHMDLKPANILLDNHMMPKITDFGLSRNDDKSQTMSSDRLLSLGYCAPEYKQHGKMSAKSDIYSLGVIIRELVTGSKEEPDNTKVQRRWNHRWKRSSKDAHVGYDQVAKCLDLAQRCIQEEPILRPNIWDITSELNQTDGSGVHINEASERHELEDMLGIEPLDMYLPFIRNKQISCFIELINDTTDDYFAFTISTTSLHQYCIHPNIGIVPPRSKYRVNITLQTLEKVPLRTRCGDEFSVQSTTVDRSLTATDITGYVFNEKLGKVIDKVNLTVILEEALPSGDQ